MLQNNIIYFSIVIILNLALFLCYKFVSKYYNLYDYPDAVRKIHNIPVPLLGGVFLILNLFTIFIIKNFFSNFLEINFFGNINKFNYFFFTVLLFFILGWYDDKRHLKANTKFFLSIFLILISLFLDKELLLTNVIFSFSKESINLQFFSYPLTIICILLFINAFNMLDGINGQCTCYFLFILLLFLTKDILFIFSLTFIIVFIFFLFLNINNKAFLGDNATLPLGYMISYIFLKLYNVEKIFLPEQVFLVMCVPGYDLLRLAILRIYKGNNPFLADNNHIHHLIMKKYGFLSTFFIVQLLLITPYTTYVLFSNFFMSFFLSIFLYIFILTIFYKHKE
jgi:UDP-GlcNAc:undecaprenyl-phosphate GlcNAc-1-phosphate transferase